MPPAKTKTPAKSHGKDIRGFFGGGDRLTVLQRPANGTAKTKTEIGDRHQQPKKNSTVPRKPAPGESRSNGKLRLPDRHLYLPPHSCLPQQKLKSEEVMEIDDSDSDQPMRAQPAKCKNTAVVDSSDEEEAAKSPPKKKQATAIASVEEREGEHAPQVPVPRKVATARKKAKDDDFIVSSDEDEEDDDFEMDEDEEEVVKKGRGKSKAKAPAKKKKAAKAEEKKPAKAEEKKAAPTEDEGESQPAKKPKQRARPMNPGSREIPLPKDPNCLAGLSFVFTGELSSLSRDEAVELAKRYGGCVVGQPSSLTSTSNNKQKTLDEDGFLQLIATGVVDEGSLDDKTRKKMEKEREAIRESAKEMERREKVAAKEASGHVAKPAAANQLWTARYAPQTLKEICGNKGQVEKLQDWLNSWSSSLKSGFKKPGKNGMNIFRAVLITGPPGIGKMTSAHLCAKLAGFRPIELNASDARSKKLVENSTNTMNASLDGWMHGGHKRNAAGVTITDKSCLIMDEVDGMSAGDRGGVGALCALIKKTKIPIICIANDRGAQKLKPLANVTYNLTFRTPEPAAIHSRILSIAFKEKMKIPAIVIIQLVQIVNMLSTRKLSSSTMDFDEGKTLAKMNEKYSVMPPFGVINKMLGPQMFSPTSRESLGDKIELYFHDPSFVPFFMQAAESISDGEFIDSLIHGPHQYWSLMPLHAVLSTVRRASFLYGMGAGYGGPNAMSFPQWLGQNSKQNKLSRQSEIRQSYIPALSRASFNCSWSRACAMDNVIEVMDEYFLTREDWDTIVELGVGDRADAIVTKKIFDGDEDVVHEEVPKKLAAAGPAPDLEEAFDVEDEIVEKAEEKEDCR
ncbi:DNA replication factor C, large subunit [Trametes cingulata]|nr:DNA replication factor C, large subunit [Trametes cingulata]